MRSSDIIPGRGDTLRVNGSARIISDANYFDAMSVRGRRPILALEIAVEEVFFHCPMAFLRSDTWAPDTWNPSALPSVAQMIKAMNNDWSLAELEQALSEDSIRKTLY